MKAFAVALMLLVVIALGCRSAWAAEEKPSKIYEPKDLPSTEKVEGQKFFAPVWCKEITAAKDHPGMMAVSFPVAKGAWFMTIIAYVSAENALQFQVYKFYNLTGTIEKVVIVPGGKPSAKDPHPEQTRHIKIFVHLSNVSAERIANPNPGL